MTKRFALGFGIGLLIFIAINLLSTHLASDCGLLPFSDAIPALMTLPGRVGPYSSMKRADLPIATISTYYSC